MASIWSSDFLFAIQNYGPVVLIGFDIHIEVFLFSHLIQPGICTMTTVINAGVDQGL